MTTTMPTISPPEVLSDEEREELLKPYRRLDLRLYTVAEVTRILDQPYHRIYRWAHPADSKKSSGGTADHAMPPIIYSREPDEYGLFTIPFVGLVQAQVATFLFQGGTTSRRIRQLQAELRDKLGCEYPLAHEAFHARATELADFGNSQVAFNEFHQGITYGDNGYPTRFRLIKYKIAKVVVDPAFSSGRPIFEKGAKRLEDILVQLHWGDTLESVAKDYNTAPHEIQETWDHDRFKVLE